MASGSGPSAGSATSSAPARKRRPPPIDEVALRQNLPLVHRDEPAVGRRLPDDLVVGPLADGSGAGLPAVLSLEHSGDRPPRLPRGDQPRQAVATPEAHGGAV